MLIALLVPLALATLAFSALFAWTAVKRRVAPRAEALGLGAVVSFFDTLGIGSFAPTMAWLKLRRLTTDKLIPATMFVGLTAPSMVQAVIFLVLLGVRVEPMLLVGCTLACLTGSVLGAPVATRSRVWVVQLIVGVGLIVAAALYALANLHLMPGGGTAAGLPVPLMVVAIVGSFVFGGLLNFGIGNYAPSLALLSLMGMDPRLCFPIMAASAAFAGAGAGARYVMRDELDMRVAVALTLGGIPAVLVAAFIVKEMPVETLRWLVVVVVLYAAAVMLRAAAVGRREGVAEPQPVAGG
jgi:uncharacterized membrane protein YfcA